MTSGGTLRRVYAALVALVLGIVVAERVPVGLATATACCGLVAVGLRRKPAASLAGLVVAAASCGALVTAPRAQPVALEAVAERIPHCELSGRLLEHAGGLGSLVTVAAATCDGYGPANDPGTVVLDQPEADPGSSLTATGWLLPLRDNDHFDRARRRLGAHSAFHVQELEITGPPRGLHALAATVRGGLERATEGMDVERSALLAGLTIGDTEGMGYATEEQLRRAGLSHLVAVSGSNVAIVVGAAALAVARLALWVRLLACLAALSLFVLVVGPEPSVVRAAAMGGVGLAALALGRRTEPLHALGVALIIVLALRPGLVFSVGLHLSAAATAGIVLFSHTFARRLSRCPLPVALALAATLAAQVAVSPVLVGVFGEFSVVAPVANLLAVFAVAPATVLGLMAAVAGPLIPPLGWVCARLAEPFVAWVLVVGQTTGSWSWASIDVARGWGWPLGAVVAAAAARTLVTRGPDDDLGLVVGRPDLGAK